MRTWTESIFSTCRSKAVTASFSPVNDKPLIRSLIFGKIKKPHGARSKLNAGWVTNFTFSEVKNDTILFAVRGEALSWCNRMRVLGCFSLTFSKEQGVKMVLYHSALIVFYSSSGIVLTGPVLDTKMSIIFLPKIFTSLNFVGLRSPSNTHTEDFLSGMCHIYPRFISCHNVIHSI
ncbi:hypothetical protein EVAR_22643_1 [Eumeta japonica]|uniref:Uncharacterized protein n=1 Tax=Eumeta variegata TaxID=151549 RepID=A0A4C1VKS3_EUMVA|nr:hypothetical protein EVAR_22643_1 [Eumeta japonica]